MRLVRIVLFFFAALAFAGPTDSLWALFQSRAGSAEGVMGEFTQTKTVAALDTSFVSTGVFSFSESEGVLLLVQKPYPSRTLIPASQMPFLWQKDVRSLEKLFEVKLSGDSEANISLTPKDKSMRSQIESIELNLTKNGDLKGMVLRFPSGDKVSYEFTPK
jgi:hypothetical protein